MIGSPEEGTLPQSNRSPKFFLLTEPKDDERSPNASEVAERSWKLLLLTTPGNILI
jgi:hypothetical protein